MLALAITLSTMAAEVRLGPETPLLAEFESVPRAQRAVQIARVGEHRLAVWRRDGDAAGTSFESVLDGRTVFIQTAPGMGRATVVAGTRSFLTVWNDGDDRGLLLARRVGLAGELLDPQPRVLATGVLYMSNTVPGVGFRESMFVAASNGDNVDRHAHARGITEDGELVDVTAPGDGTSYVILKPIWIGDELQFATARYSGGVVFLFPYYLNFGIARQGSTADVTSSGAYNGAIPPGAIALGPDRLMFVWVEHDSPPVRLAFAQSTLDGRLLRGRTVAAEVSAGTGEIEAVWNGGEFVIAWSDGNRIRAMRFDIHGQSLDATPIEISPPGATTDRPSFAVTSTGVDIAYSRFDEQAGGVARAFVRSLDRLPPRIPRRPAVRH